MYKLKIITNFSAAHFLRGYKGKCENLHGHNWRVEVSVTSLGLNSLGMVRDFSDLKKLTNKVLNELDHQNLNELSYFSSNEQPSLVPVSHNPSSEEIARYIFEKLKPKMADEGCLLNEVAVWETETACAIYSE
ncbi:MAG: 6-carboxytetrahydropterin synthase QueD [Candidatus Omnitrophica bacterium]|nr:6-carboxytetrahydropterin synthase QueD [Candidatus Omnitrophota bacterium]MDD5429947.1 6-carboxytetrahydropterin synthase QueD [Candidatus Omnitrophota bacterium]